jgi:DnaJ like chaperone protein
MWGKVILGGVGAMLGGPIGAGIGVALGNTLFDSHNNSQSASVNSQSASNNEVTQEQQAAIAYFVCLFASLAKVAKADGRVTREEIVTIEQAIAEMNLDSEMTEFVINVFREAKDNDVSVSDYLRQFAELIEYERDLSNSFFALLCKIAAADGDVSDQERAILGEAERTLRLQPGTIDIFIKTKMSLQKAYEILGCEASMSDTDIKRAYRKKCMDFHPDRLSNHGLPPEFMKFANEQVNNLHEAYKMINNARCRECVA